MTHATKAVRLGKLAFLPLEKKGTIRWSSPRNGSIGSSSFIHCANDGEFEDRVDPPLVVL